MRRKILGMSATDFRLGVDLFKSSTTISSPTRGFVREKPVIVSPRVSASKFYQISNPMRLYNNLFQNYTYLLKYLRLMA